MGTKESTTCDFGWKKFFLFQRDDIYAGDGGEMLMGGIHKVIRSIRDGVGRAETTQNGVN